MHVCMHILNVPNIIPRHPDNIFSPPFLFRLNHGCRLEIISMGTEVTLDGGSLLSMSYLTLFTSHSCLLPPLSSSLSPSPSLFLSLSSSIAFLRSHDKAAFHCCFVYYPQKDWKCRCNPDYNLHSPSPLLCIVHTHTLSLLLL